MPFPQIQIAQLEAIFENMAPSQRLKLAAEHLRWTVSNFATPIADSTVHLLVTRAAALVQEAVNASRSIASGDAALLDEIDEAIQNATEPGSSDLLMSYFLCFDELGPKLTPMRLVMILDHCYQADYARYSEPGLVVGEPEQMTAREQAILDYQRALISRYTE
jgi:hypothetical protein